MNEPVAIHPLASPWGRFHLYSFYIDAPEPAIVDTGVTSSPDEMAAALLALGRRIEDVRWILLTHGHIDHLGGTSALWEMTGRRAQVALHESDAHLLRSREAHVQLFRDVREQYVGGPGSVEQQRTMMQRAIAGEMEPTLLLRGGERLDLGGASVSVHHIPGHTAGSVAYVVDGQDDVFTGDAVQIHGAANRFPGYEDPDAYRSSLLYLRDVVRPQRMYLGHPFRTSEGVPYDVVLDQVDAECALQESLDIEAAVRASAQHRLADGTAPDGSAYSPFGAVAEDLGYTGDPTLEPSPFFTTLHGYRRLLHPER